MRNTTATLKQLKWLNGNKDAYPLWEMVQCFDEETLRRNGFSEAFIESNGLEGTENDMWLLFA